MILLLLAVAHAAPQEIWMELPTAADRARARAAGFGWAEGQEGEWYRLIGSPETADALRLRWRPVARAVDGWAPSPDDIADRLEALASDRAEIVQIGESVAGKPLLAIRIGGPGRALRVLGGHHGDEGSSVEVALAVAEAYGTGAAVLPADTELWVVPVVNPDGLAAGTRTNARAVDLNRNYGFEWSASEAASGASAFSEPETRAIRALSRARSFDAGLSLHSGAVNIGWVWNWSTSERAVEEPFFGAIAAAYAEECTAPGFWITNGADWYVTHGDTTDWVYGEWGAAEYTLEVSEEKSPPESDVVTYTGWHLSAIEQWISRPTDRSGRIVDDATGEPIPAQVWGPAVRAAWTSADGLYAHAVADPGATLTVSAPGYADAPLTAETRLSATNLLAALPTPRLLSRGAGAVAVHLPGVGAGTLRLVQPGEPTLELPADGPGVWSIDPNVLAPGAWTLEIEEGVIPRALFVGEESDRVQIATATLGDGVLTLTGTGFARGAEAWSIGGEARAGLPLVRLVGTPTALQFAFPGSADDALVWTNGAWLSVVGIQGAPEVDPNPPTDTGEIRVIAEEPSDTDRMARGTCATTGAAARSNAGSAWRLLGIAALLLRRRRAPASLAPASLAAASLAAAAHAGGPR